MTLPCKKCRIGRLRPITTAYLIMLDKQMMVVPDAPAARCDMCSRTVYTDRFLHNMKKLIDQFNNPELISEKSQWQPPMDNAESIIPTRRSS